MRTNNKLAVENLERREVFTAMPGVEGFVDVTDPENPMPDAQVTDQEIIGALNAGPQLTADHGVDSPRDAASGTARGERTLTDRGCVDDLGFNIGMPPSVVHGETTQPSTELLNAAIAGFNIGMPPSIVGDTVQATPDGQQADAADHVFAESQNFMNEVPGTTW